ncbi:MAG: hypothetical protein LQ340_002808 [Diploschistes diacapsis]|nr:MAG: hypothetical protein LQ340_002808 [Diploschistes diacapsis]
MRSSILILASCLSILTASAPLPSNTIELSPDVPKPQPDQTGAHEVVENPHQKGNKDGPIHVDAGLQERDGPAADKWLGIPLLGHKSDKPSSQGTHLQKRDGPAVDKWLGIPRPGHKSDKPSSQATDVQKREGPAVSKWLGIPRLGHKGDEPSAPGTHIQKRSPVAEAFPY